MAITLYWWCTYFMWSGALESSDLLLSYSVITSIVHNHHTNIYPLLKININININIHIYTYAAAIEFLAAHDYDVGRASFSLSGQLGFGKDYVAIKRLQAQVGKQPTASIFAGKSKSKIKGSLSLYCWHLISHVVLH